MAGPGAQGSALRGASLLILLQIASRAITFAANQILLRYLTADILGIATQLEVFYLSVIVTARDALRVAIQRQGSKTTSRITTTSQVEKTANDNVQITKSAEAEQAQATINLGYLALILGVFLALIFGWLYLISVSETTLAAAPHLINSVYIYAAAALVELATEPVFNLLQVRLEFGPRATAEAIATVLKCAFTFGMAIWASSKRVDLGVLPFAVGQAAFGGALLLVYTYHGVRLASKEGFSVLPKSPSNEATQVDSRNYVLSLFDRATLQLAQSLMAQSIVKHVLTQGDTFLVSILSTPADQGVYALAANYGSLAARLVFQPVEESSRTYFSRLLAQYADQPAETVEADEKPSVQADTTPEAKEPPKQATKPDEATKSAAFSLQMLLKLYMLVSLLLTAIGPVAASIVLVLIAGPRWAASGAGPALAAYIWYIPLLALNGIMEAFVSSVATEAEIHKQSAWMSGFSVVFGAAGYVFLRVLQKGAVGLVWANSINMICRIVWAGVFISRYFSKRGVAWDVKTLLPAPLAMLAAAVGGQMVQKTVMSGPKGMDTATLIMHLGKVAGVAIPLVGIIGAIERDFLTSCVETVRGRKSARAKQ